MSNNIRKDEWLDIYGLGSNVNGDNIVGFVAPKVVEAKGWVDKAHAMSNFFTKDDSKNHTKYLGLIELFKTTHKQDSPMVADMLKTNAVLEVPVGGSVSYDLAIPAENTEYAIVLVDSSDQAEYIGVDGAPFWVTLSKEFAPNDELTFDPNSLYGVRVSPDHPVEQAGDGFKHWLIFDSADSRKDFPRQALRVGEAWIKTGHHLAEFTQQFSTVSSTASEPGYITNEWYLGSPQGIEVAYTSQGGNMRTQGAKKLSENTVNKIQKKLEALGGFGSRGYTFTGVNSDSGMTVSKISSTLEYLAVMELNIMESWSNMFGVARTIMTEDGVVKISEGAWHQARRGKILTYSKPGDFPLSVLQEASNYMFKNSNVPMNERRITFRGGEMAVNNGIRLLNVHAPQQLSTMPAVMLGNQGLGNVPGKLIEGTDLNNLKLNTMAFAEVFLPGVGFTKFVHDPSFDFNPISTGNRLSGFEGIGGFHRTSYSLMVDAYDQTSTNAYQKVRGASLVKDGNQNSNLYYVKPEGSHLTWGRSVGRMNDGGQFENVRSALKYMGSEFWATIHSGMMMLDTTGIVIIELENTYTK